MKLAPHNLEERARWLVSIRWLACLGVALVIWLAHFVFRVLPGPVPPAAVVLVMVIYNFAFLWACRWKRAGAGSTQFLVLTQISLDLGALTLLLYYADIAHNPFLLFYVFHMILASILLPRWAPYSLAALASVQVGGVLLLQAEGLVPEHRLALAGGAGSVAGLSSAGPPRVDGVYELGVFLALISTLWITVFLTTSVTRYMERVQVRLRQSEKMLGIGQLVAGFAHQVSNPLDGLQNGLRQIGADLRGNRSCEETLQHMNGALQRMEKVARRLQEFARPQGLECGPMDLNAAVEGALQLVAPGLDQRRVVLRQELGAVPRAWGDPFSVEEVLFNLCTNALEAMPQGGRLCLRTLTLKRPDLSSDGCAAVEVEDSGVGIPAQELERVFEPFYTTKAQAGGTGLGLGLCRMLVSEMGGRIEVESRPGQGSTFRIVLSLPRGLRT